LSVLSPSLQKGQCYKRKALLKSPTFSTASTQSGHEREFLEQLALPLLAGHKGRL
jgi:hypothetical protein